jgi:hypothetical protein
MSAPTLVPKQFQSDYTTGVTWTKIEGTFDILEYALFDCDKVIEEWATWAAANGSAEQKGWDHSKHLIAFKYMPEDSTASSTSEWGYNENNGWCMYTVAGGHKDNPGVCLFIDDNNDLTSW